MLSQEDHYSPWRKQGFLCKPWNSDRGDGLRFATDSRSRSRRSRPAAWAWPSLTQEVRPGLSRCSTARWQASKHTWRLAAHGSQQLLDVAGERRLSTLKRRRAEHAVTQRASSRHGADARQLNDRCRDSVWSSMHVLRLLPLVGFLGELLDRGNKPSFDASKVLAGRSHH